MSGAELAIVVLLPDMLGTYSDAGNAVVLAQRVRWRGITAEILHVTADSTPPVGCDIYLLGGGEDTAQTFAVDWLAAQPGLLDTLAHSAQTLAVCAGVQILGQSFTDTRGRHHEGLGLLDLTTAPGRRRTVGEITVSCGLPRVGLLTGFENHRGISTSGPGLRPLGQIRTDVGIHRRTGRAYEGAVTDRVLATYLHGPVLARNPALADHLLHRVVGSRFADTDPPEVPDLAQLRRTYLTPALDRRARTVLSRARDRHTYAHSHS